MNESTMQASEWVNGNPSLCVRCHDGPVERTFLCFTESPDFKKGVHDSLIVVNVSCPGCNAAWREQWSFERVDGINPALSV